MPLLIALAAACTTDSDRDGYTTREDCDDSVSQVHPEADEECNGIDDDCDGVVDGPDSLGWVVSWPDADGDGFGALGQATGGCERPDGFVLIAGDCNDEEHSIYPNAVERCNRIDDDCDGTIDEPDAEGAREWYEDADADGWGADESVEVACFAPTGWLEVPGDCDDTDPLVHPGADDPCDGLDQDCDGAVERLVPEEYTTIQEAIDLSVRDDQICVSQGTYEERIDFGGVAIGVHGMDGSELTTLDGGGRGPVVTIDNIKRGTPELSGFTITGWRPTTAMSGTTPTMRSTTTPTPPAPMATSPRTPSSPTPPPPTLPTGTTPSLRARP